MLYSDEDEEEEEQEGEEEENARDGGGYIALGGIPHHPSHSHHVPRRKQSFAQVQYCTHFIIYNRDVQDVVNFSSDITFHKLFFFN